MSALSAASRNEPARPQETSAAAPRARARARTNRRLLVNPLRVGLAVVVLGTWEIGTTIDATHKDGLFIDPFSYGPPAGSRSQPWPVIPNGTATGPPTGRRAARADRAGVEDLEASCVYEHIDLVLGAALREDSVGGDALDRVGLERDVVTIERPQVLVVEARTLAPE